MRVEKKPTLFLNREDIDKLIEIKHQIEDFSHALYNEDVVVADSDLFNLIEDIECWEDDAIAEFSRVIGCHVVVEQ